MSKWRKPLLAILILYTILLVYLMIWGLGRFARPGYEYNLRLFSNIGYFFQIWNINRLHVIVNLVGNIVVFIPYGVLIPLIFRIRFPQLVLSGIVGISILESAQLLTKRGTFDVDDFLLNTIGIIIGYLVFALIKKKIDNVTSEEH